MTDFANAISAALLHFVWQGLLAAVLLFGVLAMLRTAPARLRYAVCCAALAGMMVLPVVTAIVVYRSPAAAAAPVYPALGLRDAVSAAPFPEPDRLSMWLAAAQAWALPIWFAGVFAFAVRLIWSYRQVARLQREGEPAGTPLVDAVSRLARRMGIGRPVRVLISGHIDSPCVAGWLRPVILMPTATLLNLSVEQLEAVLAHELAHIRRQDYLVNLLQTLAETLFFYQPGVWWVSSQIRRERELCCDDVVVELCGDAVGYARALTRLERLRVSASNLAMSSNAAPLLHRIQRLAGIRDEQLPSKLPAGLALCLALLCFATSMNWANAQPQAGREGVVKKDAIWVDTVKRGDVPIVVRALGNLTAPTTVELQVAEVQARELRDGQAASIEFRSGKMKKGIVSKVDTHAANGTVRVTIVLQEPAAEPANEPADGMIQVRTLNNVVYVGRPAGSPAIEGSLFKLDADGNVATRVKVRFGAPSVQNVQVLAGLQPGDRVILSDMAKYDGYDRVRLE